MVTLYDKAKNYMLTKSLLTETRISTWDTMSTLITIYTAGNAPQVNRTKIKNLKQIKQEND